MTIKRDRKCYNMFEMNEIGHYLINLPRPLIKIYSFKYRGIIYL